MTEQIAVLLALMEKFFDDIPLDQMPDAEHAVRAAVEDIPAEVRTRFESAEKLSGDDRSAILQNARDALTSFAPSEQSKKTS
jgi:F-type H+-transporting ATPase subunit alpha